MKAANSKVSGLLLTRAYGQLTRVYERRPLVSRSVFKWWV